MKLRLASRGLASLSIAAALACSDRSRSPLQPDVSPRSTPTVNLDPRLPPSNTPFFGVGPSIVSGDTVRAAVDRTDQACFPNWDSTGACKTYLLTARADGRLKAVLKWPPPANNNDIMDLFVVAPDGTWIVSYEGREEEIAEMAVTRGLVYSILVMSYSRSSQAFELMPTVQ